jgi:hypothetical protein
MALLACHSRETGCFIPGDLTFACHSRENGNPGTALKMSIINSWIPAFAGMTPSSRSDVEPDPSPAAEKVF